MKILITLVTLIGCFKNNYLNYKVKKGEKCWEYVINDDAVNLEKFFIYPENIGLDLNEIVNEEGENILTFAAKFNKINVLEMLLEAGTDVNVLANRAGKTALMVAIVDNKQRKGIQGSKRYEIIDKLLNKGANVDAKDVEGNNSLMLAIIEEDTLTVRKILVKNIAINAQNSNYETALILSLKKKFQSEVKRKEIVELFLENINIHVNIQDEKGKSALFYIILLKDPELFSKLQSKYDLDINMQDKLGKTALMYAIEKRNVEFAVSLINHHKIDLNLKDFNNKGIFDYVVKFFNRQIFNSIKNRKDLQKNNSDLYLSLHNFIEILNYLEKSNLEKANQFFTFILERKNFLKNLFSNLLKISIEENLLIVMQNLMLFTDKLISENSENIEIISQISNHITKALSKAYKYDKKVWIDFFWSNFLILNNGYRMIDLEILNKKEENISNISLINFPEKVMEFLLKQIKNKDQDKKLIIISNLYNRTTSKTTSDYFENIKLANDYKSFLENYFSELSDDNKRKYLLYTGKFDNYEKSFESIKFEEFNTENQEFSYFVGLIKNNYDDLALIFLDKRVPNLSYKYEGHSAIHYAIMYGKKKLIDRILAKDLDQYIAQDSDGNTSLIHLVMSPSIDNEYKIFMLDKFLQMDQVIGSINVCNSNGHTAFMVACLRGDYEIVEKLIYLKKVLVDVRDKENEHLILSIKKCMLGYPRKYKIVKNPRFFDIMELILKKNIDLGRHLLVKNFKEDNNYINNFIPEILKKNNFNFKKYEGINYFKELYDLFIEKPNIELLYKIIDFSYEGIDKNILNNFSEEGKTLLHYSVGNPNVLKELLKIKNINLNANHNNSGYTPLIEAILVDDILSLELLINNEEVNVNMLFQGNNTPLIEALLNNRLKIARILLKRDDIKIYLVNKNGDTALDIAVMLKNKEIIEMILKKDEKALNKNPNNFLDLDENQRELITRAIQTRKKPTYYISLCELVREGFLELVDIALGKNLIEVKYQKEFLEFLREYYIGQYNSEASKILQKIEEKISIFYTKTPESKEERLSVALKNRKYNTAVLLIREDDFNNKNIVNFNHFHYVIKIPSLFDCLLNRYKELNIDIEDVINNKRDEKGNTLLHLACGKGLINIIKKLIDNKAILDKINLKERTPLHIASKKNHFPIVKILVNKGASINSKDLSGNTALHYAVSNQNDNIIKLLVDKGANCSILNVEVNLPKDLTSNLQILAILCSNDKSSVYKKITEKENQLAPSAKELEIKSIFIFNLLIEDFDKKNILEIVEEFSKIEQDLIEICIEKKENLKIFLKQLKKILNSLDFLDYKKIGMELGQARAALEYMIEELKKVISTDKIV